MNKAALIIGLTAILLAASACNTLQQHVTPNTPPQSTMPTLAPIGQERNVDATVTASVNATVQASTRSGQTNTPTPTKKPKAATRTPLPSTPLYPTPTPQGQTIVVTTTTPGGTPTPQPQTIVVTTTPGGTPTPTVPLLQSAPTPVIADLTPITLDWDERMNLPDVDCDYVLQDQLLLYPAAVNHHSVNRIIGAVQTYYDACDQASWNPRAVNASGGERSCTAEDMKLIDLELPETLLQPFRPTLQQATERDGAGNTLIHWSDDDSKRPRDLEACWLYHATWDTWLTATELGKRLGRFDKMLELAIGDCIVIEGRDIKDRDIEEVDCTEEWTHKLINTVAIEHQEGYPGNSFIKEQAFWHCDPKASYYLYPMEGSWLSGSRNIQCFQQSFGIALSNPEQLDRMVNSNALKDGQCFNEFVTEEVGMAIPVDCNSHWEYRVLNTFDMPDTPDYPTPDQLRKQLIANCDRAYDFEFSPQPTPWSYGYRTIKCLQVNQFPEEMDPATRNAALDREIQPFLLNPGECIDTDISANKPLLVPCNNNPSHLVTAKGELTLAGDYPGEEYILGTGDETCAEGELYYYPDEFDWEYSARAIICLEVLRAPSS